MGFRASIISFKVLDKMNIDKDDLTIVGIVVSFVLGVATYGWKARGVIGRVETLEKDSSCNKERISELEDQSKVLTEQFTEISTTLKLMTKDILNLTTVFDLQLKNVLEKMEHDFQQEERYRTRTTKTFEGMVDTFTKVAEQNNNLSQTVNQLSKDVYSNKTPPS